jgi:hypothetical protein
MHGLYQFALPIQPGRTKFLPCRKRIISGRERGPSDTLRRSHVVSNRAHVDDPYGSSRRLLCGRREKRKEQLGEIKVTCTVCTYVPEKCDADL